MSSSEHVHKDGTTHDHGDEFFPHTHTPTGAVLDYRLPSRLAVDARGTVWRIFAPDGVGLTEETWSLAVQTRDAQQQVEPVTYYEPVVE